MICSIEGCSSSNRLTRGMCHLHYERLRTRGTTDSPPTVAERFAAKLVRMSNGCLEWIRPTISSGGYGQIRVAGKMTLAHRLAWEMTHCPKGHHYAEENLIVTRRGSRVCRTCVNTRQNARRQAIRQAS